MKYIIALADGCADLPAICGMTPLGYANTPCLARLSARAVIGRTCLIPPGCIPGSQSALLTLLYLLIWLGRWIYEQRRALQPGAKKTLSLEKREKLQLLGI